MCQCGPVPNSALRSSKDVGAHGHPGRGGYHPIQMMKVLRHSCLETEYKETVAGIHPRRPGLSTSYC